jgi:hypothetical protein
MTSTMRVLRTSQTRSFATCSSVWIQSFLSALRGDRRRLAGMLGRAALVFFREEIHL